METGQLNIENRTATGKNEIRRLRSAGKIPAVCYGNGENPIMIQLESTSLRKALDPVKGRNTLLTLTIDGGKKITAMLKEVQRNALRGDITHVDFVRVDPAKSMRVTVPVVLTGRAEGVKNGGTLHQVQRTVTLLCLPTQIPNSLEVDTTTLALGESLHIEDLKLPEGIRPIVTGDTTICVISTPREDAPKTAGAAEGAVAADTTAKKPDDKAAAAKPAAKAAAPAKK